MSFLSDKSQIALKSELDLFDVPPTQTAIEQTSYIAFHPLSSSLEGPVEFFISGGEEYIDLSSLTLQVKLQITNTKGDPLKADDKVAPTNYLLHALWSQIDILLNEKLISNNNNYSYKAYLEALLTTTPEVQESLLATALWNKKEEERQTFASGSIELYGRLHLDVCFQPKLLLNAVDVRLRLTRSKPEFCLRTLDVNKTNYTLKLDSVTLYARKVKISPTILLAHTKVLERGISAKYPLYRHELKSFIIPKGLKQYTLDNLITGVLPQRLIFGLVKNESSIGSITQNPFNFEHFNVNFISISVEGKQFPPYTPDFEKKLYAREYASLFANLGKETDKHHGLNITYKDFAEGYMLFAYDLTPDYSASDELWTLSQNGSIRLNLQFQKPLPDTITLIAFAEYQAILSIDYARTVEIEY